MTYKALRKKITGSENYEHFKSLTISINCPHLDFQRQFEGIMDIYRFFRQQAEAWEKISEEIPGTLKNSKDHFIQLRDKISNFVDQNVKTNGNRLNRNWQGLSKQLRSPKTVNGNHPLFLAEAPETTFLLEVYRDYPKAFGGAHEFIATPDGTKINSNITPGVLKGYILAYEFRLQDHTDILQRRHNEKISLGQIRSKYEEYLQQAEKDLQSIYKETKDNYDQHVQAIDELEKNKEELFDQWFGESMNSFKKFFKSAQEDAKSMKELFRDGLRFAGPVKYWRRRALQMKKKWSMVDKVVCRISSCDSDIFIYSFMDNTGKYEYIFVQR